MGQNVEPCYQAIKIGKTYIIRGGVWDHIVLVKCTTQYAKQQSAPDNKKQDAESKSGLKNWFTNIWPAIMLPLVAK